MQGGYYGNEYKPSVAGTIAGINRVQLPYAKQIGNVFDAAMPLSGGMAHGGSPTSFPNLLTKRSAMALMNSSPGLPPGAISGLEFSINKARKSGPYSSYVPLKVPQNFGVNSVMSSMNVPVIVEKSWSNHGQTLQTNFSDGQMLFMVLPMDIREKPSSAESVTGAHKVVTPDVLHAAWNEARDARLALISKNLVGDPLGGIPHHDADLVMYDENTKQYQNMDTSSANPMWVNSIDEFLEKIVPLGPFVSTDKSSPNNKMGAHFYDSDTNSGSMVISYKHAGPYDGLPNVFCVNQDTGAFTGYLVRKEGNESFDTQRTFQEILEAMPALSIKPWSSRRVPFPHLESDPGPYNSIIKSQDPADAGRKLTIDQSILLSSLGGPADFRKPQRATLTQKDRADLAYDDKAYIDIRPRFDPFMNGVVLEKVYEVGVFIPVGRCESLETGSGESVLQNLARAMNDLTGGGYRDISKLSTIRVRVGA